MTITSLAILLIMAVFIESLQPYVVCYLEISTVFSFDHNNKFMGKFH